MPGLLLLALLGRRPDGVPPALLLAAAVLAAVPVAVTALGAGAPHERLSRGWDDAVGRRLVVTTWWRPAGWTASAVAAAALVTV